MHQLTETERLQRAAELLQQRQYDRARLILQGMPTNPTAKKLLVRLSEIEYRIER